ncbi:hypothetical protein GCM10027598_80700 [Amycolatopsis oliviviridis]|uniref:Uncharacterized protein n=1 Tax=Amycolatopsis oliviviridis TaxID=1471590 RepID=A0ABQ3L859_9PSEU|nr:hypothetical protein GCM10017790_10610 [Amycolatopsis oliviviridis]
MPRKQASNAVTAAMINVKGLVSAARGAARHGIVTLGPPGAPHLTRMATHATGQGGSATERNHCLLPT